MAGRSSITVAQEESRAKASIVVLGMHRSGTSALTRMLNLGGAELSEDLTEAIPGNNEKGFFESRKLLLINMRIMNALKVEWWSAAPIESNRLDAGCLDEYRRQIDQYLVEHTSGTTTFLMKDPRMCRVFPMWKTAILKQGLGLGVVLALRNPRAVAASLLKRDGIPLDHGWFLWLRHMLEAEKYTRGVRRTVVSYEQLLKDWKTLAAKVAQILEPVWLPDWSGSENEVARFLDERLNHFDDDLNDTIMPELVEEAYGVFLEMEDGAIYDRDAQARLDGINSRLGKVDELVGTTLEYTARKYSDLKIQYNQNRQVSEQLDTLKVDPEETLEQIEQESKKRVHATQRALDRSRAQQDKMDSQLRRVEAERNSLTRTLEDARARLNEVEEQLRNECKERMRVEREYESVSDSYLLVQRQRDAALDQVVLTRKALTETKEDAKAQMKSRTTLAEQALRHETFGSLPSLAGRFNIWIRAHSELARNDGADLWRFGFDFINPERWQDLSATDVKNCARELVRRGLFDIQYYMEQSGASSISRKRVVHRFLKGEWRRGFDPSPLFDIEYYSQQAFGSTIEDAPGCPLLHYVLLGARKGIAPHPLFDPEWYRSQLPAGIREMTDPLSHYLNCGWQHNLDPHWTFNVHWYRYRNADVREAGVEPLAHFLVHGDKEGRSPHPFVDIGWYRRGLDADAENALLHLVREGIESGCSTHPLIDADYLKSRFGRGVNWFRALVEGRGDVRPNHLFSYVHYLHLNRDVTTNPLVHYIEFGWKERRRPHILFDSGHYALKQNLSAEQDPLAHYLSRESRARCSAHPMFDDAFYRKRYPDLEGSDYGLFDHFVLYGGREGRNPSLDFDSCYYQSQVDLPQGWNPLEHYLLLGKRLGLARKLNIDVRSSAGWSWIPGGIDRNSERPAVLLVAHVATGNLFGSERSFLDMVEGLHGTDLVDVIVTLPQEEAGYVSRIAPFVTGIYVRPYPWWDASKAPDEDTVDAFQRLLEIEDRVRVVHVNTTMLREPLIAARNCCRKAVVHVREIIDCDQHLQDRIGLAWGDVVAAQQELADHFICNSRATQRLYPDRSFVVPNTIEVRHFAAAVARAAKLLREDEKRPELVYVGMISSNLEKKGIGDFIQLAQSTSFSSPLRFVLIGPRSADLDAHLASGAPDNLICTGYIEQAEEAIARLDVIVNFSHFAESFGRTILEGMAASKPVVVYDYGALPILVEDGDSGYVVPYRDFKAALPLLEDLAKDSALRERLGRRGREIAVSEYDTHCYIERMREAYGAILGGLAELMARDSNKGKGAKDSAPIGEAKEISQLIGEGEASALANHEISAARILPARFEHKQPDAPLRIAYFQWHFPVPSETFVLNELRGLVAEGYDVEVFCRQSPYPDFEPDFPISWQRLDTPEDLADALMRTDRNIIHSHFTYPTVTNMVWPACRQAGAKFTFCAHAQDIFKYDNDAKNRIDEVVSSQECLAVFVPGRFHFDYLVERGVPADKIVINPQGIDTGLYPSADHRHVARSTRRLSAVHRFTEKKGLEYVIRAAPRLAKLGVQVDLWGYGEDADTYRELIRENGVDNVTLYEGVIDRDTMIRVFEDSDMFLAPSVRAESGDMDGIPTVLMEAMLCGLPVLATDVSSLPELVMDGCTGVVCSPRDADSLADAVERFYAMPDSAVERLIEAAEAHVRDRFDVGRLMRMVMRVWQQTHLDIVIVSWNNLPELQEVISRLYRHTHFPFHLLICDNDSEKDTTDWLEDVYAKNDNVTLIHKGRNSFVGPGTNTAASFGHADFIVYICGKEGFITQPWWDSAVVNHMTEHPDVGLAGTLCHSPTYLYGRDYPEGIREWAKFRNPEYALQHSERIFNHVQGGLFCMRREMLDAIGGFSDDVPHSYTDVEFSYYVESCGWELGEIPHLLALFNKTRPNVEARYDEFIYAVHPPAMEDREWVDNIANHPVGACNICKSTWPRDQHHQTCLECGASDADRSLFRALADSCLMYRRLPALATDLSGKMAEIWRKSFQGSIRDGVALVSEFEANPDVRIDHGGGSLKFVVLRSCWDDEDITKRFFEEVRRVIANDGELWVQWDHLAAFDDSISKALVGAGFEHIATKRYASSVVPFSPGDLWQMQPV